MIADTLLSRLDKVRETGPGQWLASCSAHDDRHPSLSIRETGDGTVLVKCWAGCTAYEIISAVGLELSDLFPPRPEKITGRKPERRPFPAADILRALSSDFIFMFVAASDMALGEILEQADKEYLIAITARLRQALQYVGIAP